MDEDVLWLDATAQAELVRNGTLTPAELLETSLTRVASLNPTLNAVIIDRAERARSEAAAPLPDGPFRGVPMLVKDAVAHTAGDPYHCGMQVLKDARWIEHDDTLLVARFRAAGFVIAGKTNTPELASSVTTEPLAYGPSRNPWDPSRSTGGSSGGSAAAVASGMVAVAHGNDMGGSIRIPSSICGLVGLKPTRARGTLGPDFGEYWAMTTHEHVLTRSVRDTAAVLDAVSGPGVGDPYTAPAPRRAFSSEVGTDPGRLHIGVRTARTGGLGPPHDDAVAAIAAAAAQLESLGHHVDETTIPALDDPAFGSAVGVMFPAFIARELDRWSARLGRTLDPSVLEPWNAMLADAGRATTATAYIGALEDLQRWARGVTQWWHDGHDLLLTPTVTAPTAAIGELGPKVDPGEAFSKIGALTSFSMPFNITGQPAISIPLHHGADGLPIGVQLVGAYGREDQLLQVAAQLEAATPWSQRRPGLTPRD